jgi:glutamate racemase
MVPTDRQEVLVFDSGLGGLTVLREIAQLRPDLHLIYAADDAAFPIGQWADDALADRVVGVVAGLIERLDPALVVIACNTASTLTLPLLRAKFWIPFVGMVPAIKPACERSATKRVSVLATPGTVKRDYTQGLIREFAAGCNVTLVGSEKLASLAEAILQGVPVEDAAIASEVEPSFDHDGSRTDTVVLALSADPRSARQRSALAGQLARPGPGDRPARFKSHRRTGRSHGTSDRGLFHQRKAAYAGARSVVAPVQRCRGSTGDGKAAGLTRRHASGYSTAAWRAYGPAWLFPHPRQEPAHGYLACRPEHPAEEGAIRNEKGIRDDEAHIGEA